MPLLNIVVLLIIVGVGLYLINRYIPMASSIKSILNVVIVVVVHEAPRPWIHPWRECVGSGCQAGSHPSLGPEA